MELTGRTYIFVAATLILLAGSLGFYQQHVEESGGSIQLFGVEAASCQSQAVRTANVSLGCRKDLEQRGTGQVRTMAGGAKMVRVGS